MCKRVLKRFGGIAIAIAAIALPETLAGPAQAETVTATSGPQVVWSDGETSRKQAFGAGLFVVVSDWRFRRGSGFARHETAD